MPDVQIRGGAHVAIPDIAEIGAEVRACIRSEIADQWRERTTEEDRERARYRAVKKMRRSTLLSTPAGTRVTILDGITPQAGYVWVVRYVSVYLAAAGTGEAFITTDTTSTLGAITQSKAVAVFSTSFQYQTQSVPQGACVLDADEGLYLNFTQNINGYMIAGWESPAELAGRLA